MPTIALCGIGNNRAAHYTCAHFFSTAMQRTTRWIGLVWLAPVLNVLSPVIGYARLPSRGSGELALELCDAASARQIVLAQAGSDHDASSFDHAGVPHCVYCPGFRRERGARVQPTRAAGLRTDVRLSRGRAGHFRISPQGHPSRAASRSV
ncbi:DUF2946 family protein [Burkholderia contaminans]|uniref:DUF2946 family protein n=1 Tax=Burkholderia contaminans TaxID=488447 RepID=UPI0035DDD80A